MRKNLKTSLRTKRSKQPPMVEYDALPPVLRHWLSQAALQWASKPVREVWKKSLRQAGGCEARALIRMNEIEARLLARDARQVWGDHYPMGRDQGQAR